MMRKPASGKTSVPVVACLVVFLALPALAAESTGRFVDNGDGTASDTATGLIWLRDAGALGQTEWPDAMAACRELAAEHIEGLDDGSVTGDWRLPGFHEMRSLSGSGLIGARLPEKHPFVNLPDPRQRFWTGGEGFYDSQRAWSVAAGHPAARGRPEFEDKSRTRHVWPVRGESEKAPTHTGRIPDLSETFDALTEGEQRRAEISALYDFRGLRLEETFVVVESEGFLEPPEGYPGYRSLDEFTVAETPPKVNLQVLPNLDPEFFPEGEAYQAGWANWAAVTRSADNRFYLAAGDHRGRGAQINLYEYRPDDGEHGVLERVLDVTDALGWHGEMYTDGKLHGHMDIMPDGTLWATTHRGPNPTDEWWEAGYRGAWLLSYNVETGEARNWGVPLVGQELPNHKLDTERGILFANGYLHGNTAMLSWDVNEKRVRYAGSPPNGWRWQERSMFLDKATGHFWGVEMSEEPYRFISFDPQLNRFKRHDVEIPVHPNAERQHAHGSWPTPPDADGWYYKDFGGVLVRIRPDWDDGPEMEVLGLTADAGRFPVLQIAMCPERRYIYWTPRRTDTMAIKQYDIRTGEKKVLGFLQEPILREYGLSIGDGVWGMNISDDGSFLVILDNGGFGSLWQGYPVVLVVSIPESERPLEP